MRNKTIGWICFVLLLSHKGMGQVDPHFSQFYAYPSYLNPALTGSFSGSYRLSAIFRSQWGSIASPYSTKGISSEFATEKNLNIGAAIMNQTVGDAGYSYTTGNASAAYTGVRFGEEQMNRVVFGMQAGFIHRRFDPSKMTFGDQWNATTGYLPTNPTAEILNGLSKATLDIGAGVLYYNADPLRKTNPFAGISVSHLNRPSDVFLSTGNDVLPMRYNVHAGMRIAVSEQISVTPNLLYMRQGNASEYMAGAFSEIKAFPTTSVMFGLNYRYQDAISTYMGMIHKSMMIGLTYDLNNSSLGRSARGVNSFEISISYFKPKKVKTEEVEFVCPRL